MHPSKLRVLFALIFLCPIAPCIADDTKYLFHLADSRFDEAEEKNESPFMLRVDSPVPLFIFRTQGSSDASLVDEFTLNVRWSTRSFPPPSLEAARGTGPPEGGNGSGGKAAEGGDSRAEAVWCAAPRDYPGFVAGGGA